jgi:glycosyltransferase involved in cell wall biosynthesis
VLLHDHIGEALDHLSRSAIARAGLGLSDCIVVPSTYLRDVLEQFDVAPLIVPNVADFETFQYRERAPLRPRLLSTRNLHEMYNIECTLRAFQIVERRYPDATLTLVGRGSRERALRALASRLRLTNVQFVGQVPHDVIARYYADHDLYIQSPSFDNVSNSIIEAFASGLPVVSTAVGGVTTILKHEEHGLLAPPNDHEALAAAVLRLIEQPRFAQQLARAAHATSRGFNWSAVRQEWLGLYRRLGAERERGAARVTPEAG